MDKFLDTLLPSIELLISIVNRGGLWSAASALSQWLEYSALLDKSFRYTYPKFSSIHNINLVFDLTFIFL